MSFPDLRACLEFLEKEGELVRIRQELDPDLEMAQVHRMVFEAGGPAVFYEKVKGSPFPAVSNLFGTYDRALKILEPEFTNIKNLIRLKSNPGLSIKSPVCTAKAITLLGYALPKKKKRAPVLAGKGNLSQLPLIKCWPKDGGAFIMLPQVFTMEPGSSSPLKSNIGMYRIQLCGNDYIPDREIGLHYQIHRGIANHHAKALERRETLKVSIFIGGPPAHWLAAVMPLPEGMPEIAFAGALAGRRFGYCLDNGFVLSADADFCITGTIVPGKTKREGPFGDHLGYYSLEHEFPYLNVEAVYSRKDAIWPFTVVGRPPQEDSIFGRLIHEMTGPAVSSVIPGVVAVHAVDAAGVHPLLLAKAKERYVPYEISKPRELLTHANAILGSGQLSLAKYLIIVSHEDAPELDISNELRVFTHCLERVDFKCDLHFHTCTTMDTLDYSSEGLNQGSKLVIAAAGAKKRELTESAPPSSDFPKPFAAPRIAGPGILVVQGARFKDYASALDEMGSLSEALAQRDWIKKIPLVVVVDDTKEASESFASFLWTTFSRSNPSHDVYGVDSFTHFKHWGCRECLMIDARMKPFHAPPLVPDPSVVKKVEMLAKKGGDLYGII